MYFKPKKLKNLFYRNFILLIVIPILLIILIALGIIREMVLKSAVDKIQLAQNNIVSILNNELDDTALKLSHFLQTNNSQILELAGKYNLGNQNEKYEYNNKINRLLEMMVIPKNDIIAIHFYMKDGNKLCLRDDLAIPLNRIRNEEWYQMALKQQQHIFIGGMVEGVTYRKGYSNNKMMVFTFVPDKISTLDQVEMVCLYLNSSIISMIQKYEKQPELGKIYLVDTKGNILIGNQDRVIPKEILEAKEGGYKIQEDKQSTYYSVSRVKVEDWKLISVVDAKILVKDFNHIASIIIMTSIGLFILFIIFSNTFLKNIINPINHLMRCMKSVRLGNLDVQVEVSGQEELKELGHSFNNMIIQIKELMIHNERQQKEKHEAEIKVLQSQINPHFLFNTLNAIKFMAMVAKFDSIKNMAEALMKIMSCTFKGTNSFYTIGEEIEVLKSYSYIMQIRYSDNFQIDFDIEPSLLSLQIPRLLIQPILENAITHAFGEIDGIGQIHISGKLENDNIEIRVVDNGKGMNHETISAILNHDSSDRTSSMGIGISNVNKRIKLTYGMEYGVQIESVEGVYTKVCLCIPNVNLKGENA